jgi:hypothetical protein
VRPDSTGIDHPPTIDALAATALLDTIRAALRGTDPAGHVPASVGGYLVASDHAPAENDGRRPLGQLRRILADAAAKAAMTDGQRWVIASFYGLDGYPADLEASRQSTNLVGRVRLETLPRAGSRRASRASIEGYRRRGVAAMAAQLPARPTAKPVARRAIPAPHVAPWFLDPPPGSYRSILAAQPDRATARTRILRAAVSDARGYIACAGNREPRLQDALGNYAADSCGLTAALHGVARPARTDNAAAIAAVAAALWDLVNDEARCRAIFTAADAPNHRVHAPPMAGQYMARGWLVAAPAEAAPLASGRVTVANLDAATRGALNAFRSGIDVRTLCELCLWALRKLGANVPDALAARVLMLAGRAFRHERSWRTVTYAQEILRRAGPCELWFNAAQDAVMAAGEVREFALAETLLDDQQHAYHNQFRPGPHLIPAVDVVEFSQQLALIRAGVKRRQAEHALYSRHIDSHTAARAVTGGWPLAVDSRNLLDALPDGWDGFGPGERRHGGDATGAWRVNPVVRQGELVVLRAVLARQRVLPGAPLALLDDAHQLAVTAARLTRRDPASVNTGGVTQVSKLALAVALAADEPDQVLAAATALKALGVPPPRWGAAARAAIAGRLAGHAATVLAELVSTGKEPSRPRLNDSDLTPWP